MVKKFDSLLSLFKDKAKYIIKSNMTSFIMPSELDFTKVTYGEPRDIGTAGGRMIYINYENGPITVQFPEMIVPYSMKDYEGNKNYTINLSFKDKESRESLSTLYNKINEFDEKMINDGMEKGLTWLRKKVGSRVVAETLYTKMISHAKDKNTGEITDRYPPTIKLKVPYKDGKFECETYNAKKELIDLSTVETKGARVTVIAQCLGIWVAGGKYGVSWKVKLMKIVPPVSIKGYIFKEDPDQIKDNDLEEEEDEVDEDLAHEVAGKMNVKTEDDIVESSDEDEEDEDDEIEVVKPAPAKKVAAKLKK